MGQRKGAYIRRRLNCKLKRMGGGLLSTSRALHTPKSALKLLKFKKKA